MNKLFGLFLLALAFLAPNAAYAVTCFWVGGTATWDTTNTGGGGAGGIKWASASGGGTTCAGSGTGGSPAASDDATFDGSSGGGTVTVNYGGLITLTSLTTGAFTGTLDFATNNNSVTLTAVATAFNSSGTGTRTINLGSGTWTLSGVQAIWNIATATNLTLSAASSTIAFTGTANTFRRFISAGSKTYGTITVNSSANFPFSFASSAGTTIGTLTVAAPARLQFPAAGTITITNFTNITGSASGFIGVSSSDVLSGVATISSANNWTCDFCAFQYMTFSGGGTFAGTNSINLGNNTGITITAPTIGGVGRIIGG